MSTLETQTEEPRWLTEHLRAWLKEREAWPWPGHGVVPGNVGATDLYEAYKATMQAEKAPILDQKHFGVAVTEAGYARDRVPEGHIYPNLTVTTRRQRALASVTWPIRARKRAELRDREDAEHRSRVPHQRVRKELVDVGQWATPYEGTVVEEVPCEHEMPSEVSERIENEVEEYMAALTADGTIAREVEAQFGPYLNGHPAPYAAQQADDALAWLHEHEPTLNAIRVLIRNHHTAEQIADREYRAALNEALVAAERAGTLTDDVEEGLNWLDSHASAFKHERYAKALAALPDAVAGRFDRAARERYRLYEERNTDIAEAGNRANELERRVQEHRRRLDDAMAILDRVYADPRTGEWRLADSPDEPQTTLSAW